MLGFALTALFLLALGESERTVSLTGPAHSHRGRPPAPPRLPPHPADRLRAFAEAFVAYVLQGGREPKHVRDFQTAMGRLAADGIIGPRTRARAESLLGHQVVWPTDVYDPLAELLPKHPAAHAAPSTARREHASPPPLTATPAPKRRAARPAAPKPSAALLPASPSDAASAAAELRDYLVTGKAERSVVASYQRRMGLDPDGLVGPRTRERASELGSPLPKLVAPPAGSAPAPSDSRVAAQELNAYLQSGGKRRDRIAAYQRAMGGVAADGIAGPKTYARIAELLT